MSEPVNTACESISTESDGPGSVNEHLSTGGPGPDGQPDTVVERLSGSTTTPETEAEPIPESEPNSDPEPEASEPQADAEAQA